MKHFHVGLPGIISTTGQRRSLFNPFVFAPAQLDELTAREDLIGSDLVRSVR